MARRALHLGLLAAAIAMVAVPLALAQTDDNDRGGGGVGQEPMPGMDMGRFPVSSGIAVDERYLYVLSNGVVMRVDKSTGRSPRYFPVYGDAADTGWMGNTDVRGQFSSGWEGPPEPDRDRGRGNDNDGGGSDGGR